MRHRTTITASPKPSVTQESLGTFLALETAAAATRRRLLHLLRTGSRVEPGPLGVNGAALIEPLPPLVIPRNVADVLEQVSREARTLRIAQ